MARNGLKLFSVSIERCGQRGVLTGFESASLIDAKAAAERSFGPGVCTVAVMQAGKVFDVFDGQWSSECTLEDADAR